MRGNIFIFWVLWAEFQHPLLLPPHPSSGVHSNPALKRVFRNYCKFALGQGRQYGMQDSVPHMNMQQFNRLAADAGFVEPEGENLMGGGGRVSEGTSALLYQPTRPHTIPGPPHFPYPPLLLPPCRHFPPHLPPSPPPLQAVSQPPPWRSYSSAIALPAPFLPPLPPFPPPLRPPPGHRGGGRILPLPPRRHPPPRLQGVC